MENLVKSSSPSVVPSDHCTLPASQYGFVELLGLQDLSPYHYENSSLLDGMLLLHRAPMKKTPMVSSAMESSPDTVNIQPGTPNASSISSTSSGAAATDREVLAMAAVEEEEEGEGGQRQGEGEDDEEQKTKKK